MAKDWEKRYEERKRLAQLEEERNAKFFERTGYIRFISHNRKTDYTNPMLFKTTIPLRPDIGIVEPRKYWINKRFRSVEEVDVVLRFESKNKFDPNFKYLAKIGAIKKDIDKWDILCGLRPYFVHERAIERLNKLCPNDFMAIPAEIMPSEESKEDFLIKDYYGLHIVPRIKAFNVANSVFWDSDMEKMKQDPSYIPNSSTYREYYDDRWDGHYLAEDENTCEMLWHPRAAWEFRNSKGIYFYPASGKHGPLDCWRTEIYKEVDRKEVNRLMKEADKFFT